MHKNNLFLNILLYVFLIIVMFVIILEMIKGNNVVYTLIISTVISPLINKYMAK